MWCPLTLPACVSIEHYPKSWDAIPTPAKSTDCNDIAGTYANRGETAKGIQIRLAIWLDPTIDHWNTPERTRKDHDLGNAEWVQLAFTQRTLEITAIGTDIHRQWSYRYACKGGKAHIMRIGDMSGENVALVGSDAIDLYRVKNHLILEEHGVSVGIALLIPVAAYGRAWARFPVMDDPAGN